MSSKAVSPSNTSKSKPKRSSGSGAEGSTSNSDLQMDMNTPTGRVWSEIMDQCTTDGSFNQQDLREFLKNKIGFAEGEMFRGTKIKGGAEGIFKELDLNKDGKVDWAEMSGLSSQLVETLVPGAADGSMDEADIRQLADQHFNSVAGAQDGRLTLGELKASIMKELPADTSHRSLTAQLAARMAIAAIDSNESDKAVGNRTISKEEWIKSALEMARSIRE